MRLLRSLGRRVCYLFPYIGFVFSISFLLFSIGILVYGWFFLTVESLAWNHVFWGGFVEFTSRDRWMCEKAITMAVALKIEYGGLLLILRLDFLTLFLHFEPTELPWPISPRRRVLRCISFFGHKYTQGKTWELMERILITLNSVAIRGGAKLWISQPAVHSQVRIYQVSCSPVANSYPEKDLILGE